MTAASSAAARNGRILVLALACGSERYRRQGQLSMIELDGLRALELDLLRRGDHDLGSAPWRDPETDATTR